MRALLVGFLGGDLEKSALFTPKEKVSKCGVDYVFQMAPWKILKPSSSAPVSNQGSGEVFPNFDGVSGPQITFTSAGFNNPNFFAKEVDKFQEVEFLSPEAQTFEKILKTLKVTGADSDLD